MATKGKGSDPKPKEGLGGEPPSPDEVSTPTDPPIEITEDPHSGSGDDTPPEPAEKSRFKKVLPWVIGVAVVAAVALGLVFGPRGCGSDEQPKWAKKMEQKNDKGFKDLRADVKTVKSDVKELKKAVKQKADKSELDNLKKGQEALDQRVAGLEENQDARAPCLNKLCPPQEDAEAEPQPAPAPRKVRRRARNKWHKPTKWRKKSSKPGSNLEGRVAKLEHDMYDKDGKVESYFGKLSKNDEDLRADLNAVRELVTGKKKNQQDPPRQP